MSFLALRIFIELNTAKIAEVMRALILMQSMLKMKIFSRNTYKGTAINTLSGKILLARGKPRRW